MSTNSAGTTGLFYPETHKMRLFPGNTMEHHCWAPKPLTTRHMWMKDEVISRGRMDSAARVTVAGQLVVGMVSSQVVTTVVLCRCLRQVSKREGEGKVEENSESLTVRSVCTYFFHSVLPLVVTAQTLHDRWLIVSLL